MKMYDFFIKISLKSVSEGPIKNIPASVQIMAWRRPGDKQLHEPRVFYLSGHRPETVANAYVSAHFR